VIIKKIVRKGRDKPVLVRLNCWSIFSFSLLLGFVANAGAAQGWVLGSFSDPERASIEASRLSEGLQVPIDIVPVSTDGRMVQRLVVSVTPGFDTPGFKSRLAGLGINRPWLVGLSSGGADHARPNIDKDRSLSTVARPIKAPTSSSAPTTFYLVAGSFIDVSEAVNFERKLDTHFSSVVSESILAQGKVFHRVKIGPVAEADLDLVRQRLADLAVTKTWKQTIDDSVIGAGISASTAYQADETMEQVQSSRKVSGATGVIRGSMPIREEVDVPVVGAPVRNQPQTPDGNASGFNLAVLRRSTPFLNSPVSDSPSNRRWNSEISAEYRGFQNDGLSGQGKHHRSLSFKSEYARSMNDGDDTFAFVPFGRWDDKDTQRSHFDIRELSWVHVGDGWELRSGIRRVSWGVTESQHLVDIINQTDNVENPGGEEKLGQPMVNLSLTRDWGVFDIYILPGFREREFHGSDGRPRLPFQVAEDLAIFDSGARTARTSVALRWSQGFGELALGLSHFSGTSREPLFRFQPVFDTAGTFIDGNLIPVYDVIEQSSLDALYLAGDWALKLEAISRSGQGDRYSAVTFGFERRFARVFGSSVDIGIISEYQFNEREDVAPVVGDDDVALGFRLTANDVSDSSALLMWLWDRDTDEFMTTFEASTRIGSHWKLLVEATLFSHGERPVPTAPGFLYVLLDPTSDLGFYQDEDFIKLELTRFF